MALQFLDYQLSILKSRREQYPKQKNFLIVVLLLIYNETKNPYRHTLNIFELFNDVQLAKNFLCPGTFNRFNNYVRYKDQTT